MTEDVVKKRKIEEYKMDKKIVMAIIDYESVAKKWLVEWSDRSRTWENYVYLKDTFAFQNFIEKNVLKRIMLKKPEYII